ncbi:MAG: hypothetical protein LN561_05135 [Rickettsia endosymbiont of Labidopullus appendiculatus]|nr:hypothetical protein [Rickettsia endosymbiont of Labidopullus appendiculatus]
MLEGRSVFGDLVVYKIPSKSLDKLECFTKHPSSVDSEFCKSIFGAMEYTQDSKPRYYASSFKINYHQVKDLLEKVNNGASLEGASDVIKVRESLITLLQDIIGIDADTSKSLSREWSEYVNQDPESVRTFDKYKLLKLGEDLELQDKRFNEIETKTQELSKKVDDNNVMTEGEKTRSKEMINKISNILKKISTKVDAHDPILQEVIGKVQELSDARESTVKNFKDIWFKISDIEDRFIKVESMTQALNKKVDDNNAMTEEEKTKSKEIIHKISNSLNKISTKVDAHDPILQEMIGKVQELSEAHESNVKIFMDSWFKVSDLEGRFTKVESMTQALNEKVDDNNAMTEEEKTKSKEMIHKMSEALEEINSRLDVHDPMLENITTQFNGLLNSHVFTMTNLDDLMTVLGNCGYQPWHY